MSGKNSQVNVGENLDGMFKEVYGDSLQRLVPECAILTKMIPFSEADKLGNQYHQPFMVTTENGITYAGNRPGVVRLNESVAASQVEAKVDSSVVYLRSQMSYDLAARAIGGKKAFAKATELMVDNMVESLAKRQEISLLYGGSGLATIESKEVSGSAANVKITSESWSHMWGGMENAQLDAYYNDRKIANLRGPLIIQSVDIDNRSLMLSGDPADLDQLVPDQKLYFRGAFEKEMVGIDGIISNRGRLFDLDSGKYSVLKSNLYSYSGPLTLANILSAVNKAVARGLNEKVTCFINPENFTGLALNEAALRRYDGSKEASNGFESIKFYASNGEIEIASHPFVKMGDAFILPPKQFKRIGVSDITMNLPGTDGKLFLNIPDLTCYELRAYYDLAVFGLPNKCVKMTRIPDKGGK
jgi:hypothetical protein